MADRTIAQEPGLATRFSRWIASPVTEDMDFVSVVLTTVLIVTVAVLWTRVINALVD